jgi:hypothetical protein
MIQRCWSQSPHSLPSVEQALAYMTDRIPARPTITPEAKAWLVSVACDKAWEHCYAHELTRLLARHAREHGPAAGHECLANVVQGTVCKISLLSARP